MERYQGGASEPDHQRQGGEPYHPAPGRRQARAPTNHEILPCLHEFGEYAMFYGFNRSFDDKERSPAVSRGASLPPPWGWGGLAPASTLGAGVWPFREN